MGHYICSGKQVAHTEAPIGSEVTGSQAIHIAYAKDSEAAHLIAHTLNARSQNFIRDALRTCSPNFYGEKVAAKEFIDAVNDAIDAANRLDKIKKSLFYGRDNNIEPSLGERNTGVIIVGLLESLGLQQQSKDIAVDFIHGILGKFTEAGELLEALREGYRGNGFDLVNINEEIGDGFWYDAILLNRTDATFEEVQERIIAKLKARFPDKYEDAHANERNLDLERSILEGDIGMPDDLPNVHNFSETEIERRDGGIYAKPVESLPLLAPSVPASGAEAVTKAAESASKAFDAVKAVQANVGTKQEAEPNQNPELAKPIGERLRNMPQENMARAAERNKNDG